MNNILKLFLLVSVLISCQEKKKETSQELKKGTFGYDATFLAKHQETVILNDGQAMLAICPAYQGRVMTSSSKGLDGLSYGWLNYELIESGEELAHINPFGGEDRFWLGPEGGQFSIFFESGKTFAFEDWQTPAPIDSKPFDIISRDEKFVVFGKDFSLTNYSGNVFNLNVVREISFISKEDLQNHFPLFENLNYVAYQSKNTIKNIGESSWTEEYGALSIWILGMFNPSPSTTVIVPFVQGEEEDLGPIVNDAYFGEVPDDRLKIHEGVMFFKGDGKFRSKIGLNPKRSLPYLGSFDEENGVLTIVFYSKPDGVEQYVNSMWELQEEPFAGDVINSYNDGPVDGSALGPFYELETSSPAAFLAPGEDMIHLHSTVHFEGDEAALNEVVQHLFNIDLQYIKDIF